MRARVVYLLILLPLLTAAWYDYAFYFRDISCAGNTQLMANTSCRLHWSAQNVSMVNFTLRLKEDVAVREMYAKVQFDSIFGIRKTNFQSKVDGCAMLQNGGTAKKVRKVYRQIRDLGLTNFPHKCPLKKNVDYYVRDFFLDVRHFEAAAPDVKFKVTLTIKRGQMWLYTLNVTGELENFKRNRKV